MGGVLPVEMGCQRFQHKGFLMNQAYVSVLIFFMKSRLYCLLFFPENQIRVEADFRTTKSIEWFLNHCKCRITICNHGKVQRGHPGTSNRLQPSQVSPYKLTISDANSQRLGTGSTAQREEALAFDLQIEGMMTSILAGFSPSPVRFRYRNKPRAPKSIAPKGDMSVLPVFASIVLLRFRNLRSNG